MAFGVASSLKCLVLYLEGEGGGREGGRGEGGGKEGEGIIQREIKSKEHTTTYMYILSHTSTQTRVVQFPFHSFLLMVH